MAIIQDLHLNIERSDEVNIKRDKSLVKKIIKELKETLKDNPNIPGLAAPQLGYNKRIFCINFNGDIRAFINPIISKTQGLHLTRQICPSIPGKEFIVPRPDSVISIYQTPTGITDSNKFESYAAEIFDYLLNILDGVCLTDFGLEIDEAFDKASEAERQEVLDYYVNYLKQSNVDYQNEIENNKELKQMSDAVKFMTAVQTGEVQLEEAARKPSSLIKKAQNKAIMRDFLNFKKR